MFFSRKIASDNLHGVSTFSDRGGLGSSSSSLSPQLFFRPLRTMFHAAWVAPLWCARSAWPLPSATTRHLFINVGNLVSGVSPSCRSPQRLFRCAGWALCAPCSTRHGWRLSLSARSAWPLPSASTTRILLDDIRAIAVKVKRHSTYHNACTHRKRGTALPTDN